MVDSIAGAGGSQNLSAAGRVQNNKVSEGKRAEQSSAAPLADEVRLSEEALSLSRAERAAEAVAKETRTILQEQLDETLSSDRRRVDTLL